MERKETERERNIRVAGSKIVSRENFWNGGVSHWIHEIHHPAGSIALTGAILHPVSSFW